MKKITKDSEWSSNLDHKKLAIDLLNNTIMLKINTSEVIELHQKLKNFKQETGPYFLKDRGVLESAIKSTDFNHYDNHLDRVIQIWYSVSKAHAFTNGNKRTATYLVLNKIGLALAATVIEVLNTEFNKEINDSLINAILYKTLMFWENYLKNWLEELYEFTKKIAASTREAEIKVEMNVMIEKIINNYWEYFIEDLKT